MNSQPSSSAPASSDSSAPAQQPAPGATQSPDQAPAKPHKGGAGGVKKQVAFLKEKLTLTDDEVTKVTAVLQDSAKQMMTINSDTTLSDDDKHSKMEVLHKSTHDQIRALLTPDQQTTFDSLKMPNGGGGHKKAENN